MLIVAPNGIVVLAITGLMPRFFSATDSVTGMVAELDDVENATRVASRAPRKNASGETFTTNFISALCTSTTCNTQPSTTAIASLTTSSSAVTPCVPDTQAMSAKTPNGATSITQP